MSNKIQKIKQEIERQIEEGKVKCQQSQENNDHESFVAWSEHVATCGKFLVFINSLPEEPIVKGITWEDVNKLESLIYQVHNEYPSIGEKSLGLEVLERFQDCQDVIEEPVSEDLEEAAKQHSKKVFHGLLIEDNIIAFKAGAEWQKEIYDRKFGFLNLKDSKDAYNKWKSTQDNPSAALAWVRACEWQKQQMMEENKVLFEKSSGDCSKELIDIIDKEFGIDGRDENNNPLNGYGDWQCGMILNGPSIVNLVKLGAHWQHGKDFDDLLQSEMKFPKEFYEKGRFDIREEIMKDAVETTIVNDWQYGKDQDNAIIPAIHQRIEGFNVGDKVKIIIIKPEQQC